MINKKAILVFGSIILLIGISIGSAMGNDVYTYMGVSNGGGDTYITGGNVSQMGHNHTQDLNATDDVVFNWATAQSFFGDGGNLTNVSSSGTSLWDRSGTTLYTDTDGDAVQLNKTLDIVHTATESDDHTLELDVDAAGYGDVKALDIDYITGAIAMGQDEGIILLNIDETLATGGSIFGLEILATDGGSDIYGMKTGVLIGPIHQDSGVFVNPTTGTNNTPATDVPAMIDGAVGTTTSIFMADNDYIIVGSATAFEEMEFILTTSSSNPGIKPTFWYSTVGSGQFTQFTPVDGTNGFRNTGVVAWDQSDLTGHTTNDDTGTYDIKIIRTQNNLLTEPILGYVKVASTTEYVWDKDGNLLVNKINVTENAMIFWESTLFNLSIVSNENVSIFSNDILESVTIDTDGILDFRYQPGARVRLGVNQFIPNNVWTKLNLDVEDFDNNDDYSVVNKRFVVPKDGIYSISYSAYLSFVANQNLFWSGIYVNSALAGGYAVRTCSAPISASLSNCGSDILSLNKNDFVEIWVYHNQFPQLTANALAYTNYLSIAKIG